MSMKSTSSREPEITFAIVLLLAALIVLPTKLAAQETESPEAQSEETKRQDLAPEPAEEARVTGASRLTRLQQIIKLDEQKLAETKKQLTREQTFFDKLNATLTKAEADLAEMNKRLDEMGGAEASEEAAGLGAEIEILEKRIALLKSEAEVRFNTGQTLASQIPALEQKIAKDQQALEALINPPAPPTDAASPQPPAPTAAGGPAPSTPSATQLIAPGVGTSQPAPPQPPQATQPETAEQIEARREAEKLESAAQIAEQELVSFVERKQALEEQVKLEQTLLDSAMASRKNLDLALEAAEADLERLIEQGASKAKLRETNRRIADIQALQQGNRTEIDQRREHINSLYKRQEEINQEQLLVTQQIEAKRQEAIAARKRSVWLESPLHPRNVWNWFLERGPRILMVIVVAWALLALVRVSSRKVARTLVAKVGGGARQRGANRADTLALSFQSAATLFIIVTATLLAFQEAGVDIKTVLGGAAILGVAFAFGAQNLMRDYFTGFMIVLEDQYELGDLVTIGAITGTVEKVNMRTTVLRDLEGRVHFIPNGEIKSVTNRTYVWGRAVLEIPVGFKEDADRVMNVIRQVEEEFRADPEFGHWVTGDPVMMGIDKFTEYGMIIKTFVQTQPDKIFPTRRELLRRIKKRFDEEGIEISVPHLTLRQPESA